MNAYELIRKVKADIANNGANPMLETIFCHGVAGGWTKEDRALAATINLMVVDKTHFEVSMFKTAEAVRRYEENIPLLIYTNGYGDEEELEFGESIADNLAALRSCENILKFMLAF